MAWTTPRTWVAGEIMTAANMNTHLRDNLGAIGDAWTAYTPTLTNWTLGNGTLAGFYLQAGKLIHFRIQYTVGSTDVPSSTLVISLPVGLTGATGDLPLGEAAINDATGNRYLRYATAHSSSQVRFADSSAAVVTSTVPFTFASGDTVYATGQYEAA